MKIVKRDGHIVDYCPEKIEIAMIIKLKGIEQEEIRFDSMPSLTRTALAAFARRAPSAKLYSVEPRSSQLPAIWIFVSAWFFIYSDWPNRLSRASSEMSEELNAKNTR